MTPLLIRDTQVAELLNVSRQTVWNRVRSGVLPKPIKFGGCTRWRVSDIKNYIDQLAG